MSEELILSPKDPAWHERRREVYTASDMGVLFGLPGFAGRTLSDVWFEKRYGIKDDRSTPSTRLGQRMESLILDEAETELGPIGERQEWYCKGNIGATLDGRCRATGRPVEAKTSGLLWRPDAEWGDGGDEVPSLILLQTMAQIYVTDEDGGHVAAIIGGRGFMLYEIARHEGLIDDMQRRVDEFWETLANDTPPAEPPQLETLKRIRRQPNKVIERSDELDGLLEQWGSACADVKIYEHQKEQLQAKLLAKLGDAEAAETSSGLLTYYEQTRKETLSKASTFRVLRLKKGA